MLLIPLPAIRYGRSLSGSAAKSVENRSREAMELISFLKIESESESYFQQSQYIDFNVPVSALSLSHRRIATPEKLNKVTRIAEDDEQSP